jgi:hypothetical protein
MASSLDNGMLQAGGSDKPANLLQHDLSAPPLFSDLTAAEAKGLCGPFHTGIFVAQSNFEAMSKQLEGLAKQDSGNLDDCSPASQDPQLHALVAERCPATAKAQLRLSDADCCSRFLQSGPCAQEPGVSWCGVVQDTCGPHSQSSPGIQGSTTDLRGVQEPSVLDQIPWMQSLEQAVYQGMAPGHSNIETHVSMGPLTSLDGLEELTFGRSLDNRDAAAMKMLLMSPRDMALAQQLPYFPSLPTDSDVAILQAAGLSRRGGPYMHHCPLEAGKDCDQLL